ncbi:MAG: hypothetical protein ABIN89_14545 [Chitinophagaceae bacterium]
MKKYRLFIVFFSFFTVASFTASSQQSGWPKTFNTNAGVAKLYEPAPESFQGNLLKIRAAVSLVREGKSDPVFGVLWADIEIDNGQSNNLNWQNATVTNIKFPGEANDNELDQLTKSLEKEVPSWNISISKNDLMSKLENNQKESKLSETLNNNPPKIIYTKNPSILVLIDGQPQLSNNTEWGVEQVSNTPFTIIKNTDGQFYMYGAKRWYRALSINGSWSGVNQLPSRLDKIDQAVRASDTSKFDGNNAVANIIVSTEPAELIQSDGEANFTPIQGTNLLYMSNSGNDIFMDVNSQLYYVLISGRWYKAPALNSSWIYISADKLPADFAKIPEGSPKDVVLPNVAGTDAANESVMEAQVPQTAKVDRKNAKASVVYDGDPTFEQIEGTHLKYAINTAGTVLNLGRKYYYIENGVWFESNYSTGPWIVATTRPEEVENIPPSYPVYNAKYVYIYDATPDYVYMGYTPGYLGNYVYGPTIVYGTGYYYKPWRGRYYYPRATTWGFNMRYNPWTGWNFGLDYWGGWFSFGIGNYNYYHGPVWGGWWGPQVYRPAYCRPYNYNYGYYGYRQNRNIIVNNYRVINNNRSNNNIYHYRRDVVTHDRPGFNNSRNNGVRRPTSFNSSNNGQYNNNNGRVMPGNNNSQGNRTPDRTPSRNQGDRQVTRTYQPNNQQGRGSNPTRTDGNTSQDRNTTGSLRTRPGSLPNGDANERIYTPSQRNGRVNEDRSANTPQNRPNNPVTENTRPSVNRPFNQNRSANPGNTNPSAQEQPVRVAQDRNFNPRPAQDNSRPQRERPSLGGAPQNRTFTPPSSSPSPRVERPSVENSRGNGGGRSENNSRGRGGREN